VCACTLRPRIAEALVVNVEEANEGVAQVWLVLKEPLKRPTPAILVSMRVHVPAFPLVERRVAGQANGRGDPVPVLPPAASPVGQYGPGGCQHGGSPPVGNSVYPGSTLGGSSRGFEDPHRGARRQTHAPGRLNSAAPLLGTLVCRMWEGESVMTPLLAVEEHDPEGLTACTARSGVHGSRPRSR
jgi:hypothetical protein